MSSSGGRDAADLDSLLGAPAPGPEDPIGMLRACHQRMLENCALLERLNSHLEAHGHDAQTTSAAARILRYFDTAALDHHQDEEQDLFPLLARHEPTAGLITRLSTEHPELEAYWHQLKPLIESVVKEEVIDSDDLSTRSARFVAAYRDHIDRENTQLLPLAEQVLTPSQKLALGKHMAARRGLALK